MSDVLEILRAELDRAFALMGVHDVEELGRSRLIDGHPLARPTTCDD